MKYPILNGYITSGYGDRISPINGKKEFHPGLDITSKGEVPQIVAPCRIQLEINGWSDSYGWRCYFKILEGEHVGKYMLFAHMARKSTVLVKTVLTSGQFIGYMGSTGWSTKPHLHWGIIDTPAPVSIKNKSYEPTSYIQ